MTILFQGDKCISIAKDGNRQDQTILLRPEQHPKAIDHWDKSGDQPVLRIYCLKGDTLRWCSAGAGSQVRPTTFVSATGPRGNLLVLLRQKTSNRHRAE